MHIWKIFSRNPGELLESLKPNPSSQTHLLFSSLSFSRPSLDVVEGPIAASVLKVHHVSNNYQEAKKNKTQMSHLRSKWLHWLLLVFFLMRLLCFLLSLALFKHCPSIFFSASLNQQSIRRSTDKKEVFKLINGSNRHVETHLRASVLIFNFCFSLHNKTNWLQLLLDSKFFWLFSSAIYFSIQSVAEFFNSLRCFILLKVAN